MMDDEEFSLNGLTHWSVLNLLRDAAEGEMVVRVRVENVNVELTQKGGNPLDDWDFLHDC